MRVALIGCGFFAQNQLEAWRDIHGVDVVALRDTDPTKLNATGKAFDIAHLQSAWAPFQDGLSKPNAVRGPRYVTLTRRPRNWHRPWAALVA